MTRAPGRAGPNQLLHRTTAKACDCLRFNKVCEMFDLHDTLDTSILIKKLCVILLGLENSEQHVRLSCAGKQSPDV